jgi:fibronectin type 3 domain-containing protein
MPTTHLYQIKVRDPDGEPLGVVQLDATSSELAVKAARERYERPADADEDNQAGFPPGSEFEAEQLDSHVLYTVEVYDGNESIAAHEVAAASPEDAEADLTERINPDYTVKAVGVRKVYPDSLVPVVHQGGPTPL